MQLTKTQETVLNNLSHALVNQQQATVIVPAQENSTGFWFGGGNLTKAPDGTFCIVGRYRNYGDSRTGVSAGERGLELAIFASTDEGESFQKVLSFTKEELNVGEREVLSIEGTALNWTKQGVELFVSTEKSNLSYPDGFESYLKPGTGVWTVDLLQADNINQLKEAAVVTLLESNDPATCHIKDPFVYQTSNNDCMLLFCTHPFGWTSSNTGYVTRSHSSSEFSAPCFDFFPRGLTWDVAMTRGTAVVDVPQVGQFENQQVSLIFYDGGECVRNLDEHKQSVSRPRGYSCEELGGVAYITDGDFSQVHRLSKYKPMFLSPHGTGCSRYVDVLQTDAGMFATWQQSQEDCSQPLVMNKLGTDEIKEILS